MDGLDLGARAHSLVGRICVLQMLRHPTVTVRAEPLVLSNVRLV